MASHIGLGFDLGPVAHRVTVIYVAAEGSGSPSC